MFSDLLNKQFTVSEAAAVAGVDVETLRSWMKRGKFKISSEKGKWSRFTFRDLCQIATFANIVAAHGDHVLAATVGQYSVNKFADILRSVDEDYSPYALIAKSPAGEHIFVEVDRFNDMQSESANLVSKGIPVWITVSYLSVFHSVFERLGLLEQKGEGK